MNKSVVLWSTDIHNLHRFLIRFGDWLISEGFPKEFTIGPVTVEKDSVGHLVTVLVITTDTLPFITVSENE